MSRRASLAASLLGILFVTALAFGLRLHAVDWLPIDFDEDDYLRAGQLYAAGLRDGDPGVLLRENYRPEHPPLSKIVTGLALTPLESAPLVPDLPTDAAPAASLPEPHLEVARTVQAAFGALAVLLLAIIDPLGGLFLAVHTWSIKYTSQVMLEAVPAAFAVLAAVAFIRADRSRHRRAWLVTAAVAFGAACAGKYLYGVVGLAIALTWLVSTRDEARPLGRASLRWLAPVAGFVGLAALAFLVCDPYLWPDPVGRLVDSLAFHPGYATSDAVARTGWPAWQPLVWLFGSVPFHIEGTFYVALDLLITILAIVGLRRLWDRQRVMAVWLLLGLAFLIVWPTKWPQYVLVLSAPVSLAAAHGLRLTVVEPIGGWIRARLRGRGARSEAAGGRGAGRPAGAGAWTGARRLGSALPWLVPGLLALAVLAVLPLLYESAMALTDFSGSSLRDGINGGVVREAVGGLAGQIPAAPVDLGSLGAEVRYVGTDLPGGFISGIWFGDDTSSSLIAFSVLWTALAVACQTVLGVAVAFVLARPGLRFANAWRLLFILPWAIPEFVGAIAWRTIFYPENGFLSLALGVPLPWPASPEASLLVLLVAATWMGFPLMMLVATAGLKAIPSATVEAAALDGASGWARARLVVLPMLMPLLAPAIVIKAIGAFNQFYLFYVLGPSDKTLNLATWSFFVFDTSRGPGLFAISAAINILTLIALAVLVIWFLGWRERAERVPLA